MNLYTQFTEWIDRINAAEKPDESIIAFNFGIFETPTGYSLYVIGSKEYDEDDLDWATNNDFEPKEKYFPLDAYEVKDKKWQDALQITLDLLGTYTKSVEFKSSIFKNAVAITTGFDGGDLISLI